jgi:hypothetical protein
LEFSSPSRRIFIGSHSLPPLSGSPYRSFIRSTITVVETLATVLVIVVVAPGPLGGRRDSKGALQLLALSHGVLSIAVKLALVFHDHVEVTFEEGGRFWWIRHIGFAGSFA